MLSEKIDDEEYLYRRVPLKPIFWVPNENRISSALFKDSKGVSVDRQGQRTEEDVINTFTASFELRAVVKLKVEDCRKIGTYVQYKPIPENLFHSEITESETEISIKSSKARKLQEASIVVYQSPIIDL